MSGNIKSFRVTEESAGLRYEYEETSADGESAKCEGILKYEHLEDEEIVQQIRKFVIAKERRRIKSLNK